MLRAMILRTVPSWEVSSTPHELVPLAAAGAGAGRGGAGGRRGRRCGDDRGCDDRRGSRNRRSGRRRAVALLQELLDVLLGHPSAATGAGNLGDVEPVLGDHARDDRRHEADAPRRRRSSRIVRRRLGRGWRRCGGGGATSLTAAASGAGAGSAGACAAGAARGGATASIVPASPEVITAMRVPTSTVSPSGTRISETTPLPGDGTSVSTLSVEISTIVSSASTRSPTCFRQRVIVPSDTLTPIWGITTSTAVPVLTAGGPRGGRCSRVTSALVSHVAV